MKKSFMTRVLAMGLSFAMAFSLSAATNVTTASAAAKKVGVTTMMKVSTKSVTEGKSVKTYMNSTALKKYRIKKVAKLSAVADKYIDVDVITTGKKARQGLEITAHEGAVTAAKLTKKGVYVTIYFAQTTSATKAAKATAVKYAKLKVAVQAKPVEKLTMTAAATKVKQITVTFNKEVDTATTKITVTKGNATPTTTVVFADDAKSAVVTMGAKMTEGTYTVTVKAGDDTLTADVKVEDEKLTKFELVNNNLVATATNTTCATISYKALNQYDEMMKLTSDPQVSCSFSSDVHTSDTTDGIKSSLPTVDAAGVIYVRDINTVLAIQGTKGVLVLVDQTTGVNSNCEITYMPKAYAAKVTVGDLYNVNKATAATITRNDKVNDDYYLLLEVEDQYGSKMDAATAGLTITAAQILTNLDVSAAIDYTVNGKDYIAVPIHAASGDNYVAKTGTLKLTIVGNFAGLLATPEIVVEEGKVIKSLTISADNGIYSGKTNELSFEALDANGNAITDYATLKNTTSSLSSSVTGYNPYWEKQTDGSAKLKLVVPSGYVAANSKNNAKTTITVSMNCNPTTSADFFVKTQTLTCYQNRVYGAVAGLDSKVVLSAAAQTGQSVKIKLSQIKVEDQFGNVVATTDTIYGNVVTSEAVWYELVADNGIVPFGIGTQTGSSIKGAISTGGLGTGEDPYVEFLANGAKVGTAKLYMKYGQTPYCASATDYDYKVTISTVKVTNSASYEISQVNTDYSGAVIYGESAAAVKAKLTESNISVVGLIGGGKVTLPSSQYKVTGMKVDQYDTNADGSFKKQEKEGTVEITVDTGNGGSEVVTATFKYSNADSKIAKIEKKTGVVALASGVVSDAGVITSAVIVDNLFKVTDQYGQTSDGAKTVTGATTFDADYVNGKVKLNIVDVSNLAAGVDGLTISHNDTVANAQFKMPAVGTTYGVSVTATYVDDATINGKAENISVTREQ